MTDASKYLKDAHKIAVRTIGYALTLGNVDAWAGASQVLRKRLTANERAAMAWAILGSLNKEQVLLVIESFNCFKESNFPNVCLHDPVAEAKFWVADASPEEINTYAMACFNKMSPETKQQFIAYLQEKNGAA